MYFYWCWSSVHQCISPNMMTVVSGYPVFIAQSDAWIRWRDNIFLGTNCNTLVVGVALFLCLLDSIISIVNKIIALHSQLAIHCLPLLYPSQLQFSWWLVRWALSGIAQKMMAGSLAGSLCFQADAGCRQSQELVQIIFVATTSRDVNPPVRQCDEYETNT